MNLTIDQSARLIDPIAQALRAIRAEAEEAAEAAEIAWTMAPVGSSPTDVIDAERRVEFIRETLAEYVVRGGDVLHIWDRSAESRITDHAAFRQRLAAMVEPHRMAA